MTSSNILDSLGSQLFKENRNNTKIRKQRHFLRRYTNWISISISEDISIEEKRFAFAARTRGLNLKNNFKLGKTNLQCRLCNDHLEDQQSLLVCPALIQVGQTQTPLQPRYSDIFSNNMDKLSVTIKILYKKYQEFQIQVNRQPTRPSSSAPTINVDNDNDIDVNNVGELE